MNTKKVGLGRLCLFYYLTWRDWEWPRLLSHETQYPYRYCYCRWICLICLITVWEIAKCLPAYRVTAICYMPSLKYCNLIIYSQMYNLGFSKSVGEFPSLPHPEVRCNHPAWVFRAQFAHINFARTSRRSFTCIRLRGWKCVEYYFDFPTAQSCQYTHHSYYLYIRLHTFPNNICTYKAIFINSYTKLSPVFTQISCLHKRTKGASPHTFEMVWIQLPYI
jgi:hypothetical protein